MIVTIASYAICECTPLTQTVITTASTTWNQKPFILLKVRVIIRMYLGNTLLVKICMHNV